MYLLLVLICNYQSLWYSGIICLKNAALKIPNSPIKSFTQSSSLYVYVFNYNFHNSSAGQLRETPEYRSTIFYIYYKAWRSSNISWGWVVKITSFKKKKKRIYKINYVREFVTSMFGINSLCCFFFLNKIKAIYVSIAINLLHQC